MYVSEFNTCMRFQSGQFYIKKYTKITKHIIYKIYSKESSNKAFQYLTKISKEQKT